MVTSCDISMTHSISRSLYPHLSTLHNHYTIACWGETVTSLRLFQLFTAFQDQQRRQQRQQQRPGHGQDASLDAGDVASEYAGDFYGEKMI